jgi:integrase
MHSVSGHVADTDDAMTTKLTDKTIRTLASPANGNRIEYDTESKGFGVRVTSAGAKAFILNYRANGRERRITIGSFPDWGVTAAREHARSLKRRIDVGEDPMGDRHAEREAPTMKVLADRYEKEHATRKAERSAKEDASLLQQLIRPKLGNLRVAAVRRSDVEDFHRAVSNVTPIRANRALSLLTKMFNLAIGWEMRPDNPCKGIERNPEHKRDRYLSAAELERVMAALATHKYQASANAVRLLLLTGARRGEVLSATWDQFDIGTGVWTKPAATTKQRKLHRIPLSAPAMQLLAEMKEAAEGAALFPGRGGNEAQTDLKRFWASICATAAVKGVRLHDLRHSYASYLASAGLSLPVIGALLGHSSPVTTSRYAHLLDDPLRAATERVGAFVSSAGKQGASIVRLRPVGAAT